MPEPELSFRMLARNLPARDLPLIEPPSDLWQRIAQRHQATLRRSRRRRIACAGALAAMALGAVGAALRIERTPAAGDVDWQARAQALEIRLHALDARAPAPVFASVAQDELLRLDTALQDAYDRGADGRQIAALWKRRSELLAALLQAREQNAQISRI